MDFFSFVCHKFGDFVGLSTHSTGLSMTGQAIASVVVLALGHHPYPFRYFHYQQVCPFFFFLEDEVEFSSLRVSPWPLEVFGVVCHNILGI